jgi:hypothetical protein
MTSSASGHDASDGASAMPLSCKVAATVTLKGRKPTPVPGRGLLVAAAKSDELKLKEKREKRKAKREKQKAKAKKENHKAKNEKRHRCQ